MPDTHDLEMEIFAAGKWNGDSFTLKDLQDMVTNFNSLKDNVKPFLKIGGIDPHQDLIHQPAVGWIESLSIKGDRLIAQVKDIPKIVFEAIKRKLYRRVSSEIYFNYKADGGKVYNYVLRAVALLGAAVPAVSNLEDLAAYFSSDRFSVVSFKADDQKLILEEEQTMPENDLKEFQEKLAAEEKARKEAEEKATKAESELKAFQEAEAKRVKDGVSATTLAFFEQKVKEGKIPPFVRDQIFPKDKPALILFSDQKEVFLPFKVFEDFFSKIKLIDFSEKGENKKSGLEGKNPGELVDERARELQAQKKVSTYSEGVSKVLADDPELAKAYAEDPGKRI